METLLRSSGWLTLGAVLLASLAWAQSRGTSEDESAIKALVESQNRVLVQGVGNLADVFAADVDWTNAWGRRLHGLGRGVHLLRKSFRGSGSKHVTTRITLLARPHLNL